MSGRNSLPETQTFDRERWLDMAACDNPPCIEVGPFRYCPVKGCGWMEEPAPKPSLDEFVTTVVDALPPATWDVVVWPGDDMAVSGRIDPADARRIISAALTAIRGDS